jgi:hypothetical protein
METQGREGEMTTRGARRVGAGGPSRDGLGAEGRRCAVCGSPELRLDEVVDRVAWRIGECGRCGHRFLERAFLRGGVARAASPSADAAPTEDAAAA